MNIKRNSDIIVLFLVGLFIGLLISYGIRELSRPSSCSRKLLPSYNVPVKSAPQQIVNLASGITSTSKNNNYDNLKLDQKYYSSHQCTGGQDCESRKKVADGQNNVDRKLLFVGVMTANLYIGTRAKAVWETWAQEIQGKVVFFTGGISYSSSEKDYYMRNSGENDTIPLVPLPGVDDSYPPQKKSFMMLKYMYENYGNEFEWFMRADDDVYIRSDKLAAFLRSIDSRHLYFIGQAGKGNQIEKGTLNLAHDENFCMGGPGIIMSRPTLMKVAPHLEECLQNMYSTHEDVEVGRCVRKYAGISCTWAYEMQTIFHHNSSGDQAFTGSLKRREVHKAITLHPIKNFQHLYRMHMYFQSLKIQDLLYDKLLIHRDLLQMMKYLDIKENDIRTNYDSVDSPWLHFNTTGQEVSLNKFLPTHRHEILPWDFIGRGTYSVNSLSPKQKFRSDSKEGIEDAIREIMDIINGYSRIRGRIVDFKEILYGYKRVNPLHGIDYIFDILLTYKKYRGRKMTIPVRRHVYVQRSFGQMQLRQDPFTTNINSPFTANNRPNLAMIVPLSGRFSTFQRFISSFVTSCLDLFDNNNTSMINFDLNLVVVFFGSDTDKEKYLLFVKNKRASLAQRINGESQCKIKMVQVDGEFSRGVALETGISQCEEKSLLFLIDVDLTFTSDVIIRVYLNTRVGQQAYFPIVFSQYNPTFNHKSYPKSFNQSTNVENSGSKFSNLDTDAGYWREFGYGIASFYKSDFRKAGGFDTSIKGWGLEDVALFDRFLHHTNLTIFRAPDPDLIHVFHETECPVVLPKSQLEMCVGSQSSTLGSTQSLMRYLYEVKEHDNHREFFT